jgi:hypothetical protein
MIDAIRILIVEEKLDYKEVLCRFKELTIRIDKYASMSDYPEGFCDIYNNILMDLIEKRSRKD